ncbi:unnamed protein product [Haemonchus placei]|uniref:Transposase n=1 Tax=Haemonchus placei TaxID=6290 RepID=A0A0N4WFN3_HAEPC|nr:unnamed protein product [Haemonchus placei]
MKDVRGFFASELDDRWEVDRWRRGKVNGTESRGRRRLQQRIPLRQCRLV